MITSQQIQVIKDLTKRFDPTFLGIFGSYARGSQRSDSDLDILIDFNKRINLLDIISLEDELSKKLGISVDLVTRRSVNQQLKPYIEKDLIRLS